MLRRPHRHILVPHCRNQPNCKWLICVTCNGFGVLEDGRWVTNPYKFVEEPTHDNPS